MMPLPLAILAGTLSFLALIISTPWAPLQKVGIFLVGLFKGSVGKVIVRTVATVLVVFLAFSAISIQQLGVRVNRSSYAGTIGVHEDKQELLKSSLEAAFIAFSLFVGMLLDRLHSQIKQSDSLQVNIETLKKQAKGLQDEYMRLQKESDGMRNGTDDVSLKIRRLRDEISSLEKENDELKAEVELRSKEARTAEASVAAIKKQTEGLRLEFDRLLDDNENLREQLGVFDRKYAKTEKKRL